MLPCTAFPLPKPPGPVSPPRPVQPIHNTSTDPDETLDIGEEEQPTIERIFLLSGMTQQASAAYFYFIVFFPYYISFYHVYAAYCKAMCG